MKRPFPPEWQVILERNVRYFHCLPGEQQEELKGLIQVFLDEKRFEGAAGLEITEEIRLTVAAQACVLLLGRETDFYPGLFSIIIYPHVYLAPERRPLGGGVMVEELQARLGESWARGAVVLSWNDVSGDASDIHDGHNVVFHEFAHQLDNESGVSDGIPRLANRSMYIPWARVLGREYQALIEEIRNHQLTFLNEYGATNAAEFFAVVTEFFFERPAELKRHNPELYDQLRLFYRQDPASWRGLRQDAGSDPETPDSPC